MIHDAPVRGRIVRLEDAVDTIVARHRYPPVVGELLAETLVVAAMLASNLKTEGVLTIQMQSKGPVRLLVVDAAHGGNLRGYAGFDAERLSDEPRQPLPRLFEDGCLAITLDPGEGGQRYQGVVPLEGGSITETVQHYFTQSQQLQARFHVAIGTREEPGKERPQWIASGIYIERMPEDIGEQPGDAWMRVQALLNTLSDAELLDSQLPLHDVLYRLFHEDGVWVYDPVELNAACRCSRAKIAETLQSMPPPSREEMAEDGTIEARCQFCNQAYRFTLEDFA